ncbi:MAG TPA: purine-nucleoside phosphorylase [Gemmatimonadaceae bacterium]|nr:purine-nucleoside phosphorylase [Gemmatimonadaceae bacterium]
MSGAPFRTASMAVPSGVPGASAAALAADVIRRRVGSVFRTPACGIVLGSGLGGLASAVEDARPIPFADIPGFPAATVAGHAGQLILGTLEGVPVAMLAGRLHLYEGHDAGLAGYPVRVLRALGAPIYLASNAAGGINRNLHPGDLMLLADHINLMFRNPLHGPVQPGDERFPDMSSPYDAELRAQLHAVARAQGLALKDGVYMGLLGPTYETPAEVRMLEKLGADAVGMSTVPEVIVARALGMRAAAISLITNPAAGLSATPLNHAEVLEVGQQAASRFQRLVRGFVATLA